MIIDWAVAVGGIVGGFLAGVGALMAERTCKYIYRKIRDRAARITASQELHTPLRMLEL